MTPARIGSVKPGMTKPATPGTGPGTGDSPVGPSYSEHSRGSPEQHVAEAAGAAAATNVRATGAEQAALTTSEPPKPSRIPKTGQVAGAQPLEVPADAALATPASPADSALLAMEGILAQQIADDISQAVADLQGSGEAMEIAAKFGLSTDEAAAIRLYTHAQYFRRINDLFRRLPSDTSHLATPAKLREIGGSEPTIAKLAADIVSAMLKLPPAQDDPSFTPGLGRAVNLRGDLESYQPKQIVSAPTLLSATLSSAELTDTTWWHTKGQILVIRQKDKGCGRNISVFSIYKNEQEICFLPNTKFRVVYRSEPTKVPPGFMHDPNTGVSMQVPQSDNLHPEKIFIVLEEL